MRFMSYTPTPQLILFMLERELDLLPAREARDCDPDCEWLRDRTFWPGESSPMAATLEVIVS